WEHAKPAANAALNIPLIEKTGFLTAEDIRVHLHCSSFWGSKRGLFNHEELDSLSNRLVNQGEAVWINGQGWWDDAFLFNYMTLRAERPLFNFTRSTDGQERTGNCANADPFVAVDQVLYNQQGMKPIHRIHYMGYSSTDFARLCRGEDVDIPFKHLFLHYRFASQPEQRPSILRKPNLLTQTSRSLQKKTKRFWSYIKP
ncbi:methionine synthase, partial [Leptolyngbya cf. ectocarpi LEGE 11479]|nr:methionine synthase [Leptolyngbya cf. ectocarpi LEGE 11479]